MQAPIQPSGPPEFRGSRPYARDAQPVVVPTQPPGTPQGQLLNPYLAAPLPAWDPRVQGLRPRKKAGEQGG